MERLEKLFFDYGYTTEEYLKIINFYSFRYYSKDKLYDKIINIYGCLCNLGYSNNDIISMTVGYPSIYAYGVDYINEKINFLLDL